MQQGEMIASITDRAGNLPLSSIGELMTLSVALGARRIPEWSDDESRCLVSLAAPNRALVSTARHAIRRGHDPLGDAFSQLLSPEQRRPSGATYTPHTIIRAMLDWAAAQLSPARIVDPGTGSARFLVAAGRRFPRAELLGVELDPRAAILARGHLAAAGMADRAHVMLADYRAVRLPPISGTTLYVGNPPYVRHHLIDRRWKRWLVDTARRYDIVASQLAGLHAYFFLATAELASAGDVGVMITAAEWLDVNYGRLVRELLLGVLGVRTINVIEPTAMPFAGTATTAAITGFEVGSRSHMISLGRVASPDALGMLQAEREVRRERLEAARRWTPLTRAAGEKREGFVELGELCRVHRGQVTGANEVWIAGLHSAHLPDSVLYPSVTKARELFAVDGVLADTSGLRRVIDLPAELDVFDAGDRRNIERFLRFAKSAGADRTYIALHRKAWWSVGLREPAPILATYMARRPPVFVRNIADARHINIAHGLYPREPLAEPVLLSLAAYLNHHTQVAQGRTYAGGLTKFEPREMERLLVPHPDVLASADAIAGIA